MLLSVIYRTSIQHLPNQLDHVPGIPWTLNGEPTAEKITSKIAFKGRRVVIRCKAMGYPKPNLSWVRMR